MPSDWPYFCPERPDPLRIDFRSDDTREKWEARNPQVTEKGRQLMSERDKALEKARELLDLGWLGDWANSSYKHGTDMDMWNAKCRELADLILSVEREAKVEALETVMDQIRSDKQGKQGMIERLMTLQVSAIEREINRLPGREGEGVTDEREAK